MSTLSVDAAPMTGTVTAIYVSPARGVPMRAVEEAEAVAGSGIIGDRYFGSKHRHVSIQSAEHLAEAAAAFDAPVPEDLTRRNITVEGVTLPTRPGERMTAGSLQLEVVRIAAPCRLLDDTIGDGARVALRHRAGTIFRILEGGLLRVGDPVVVPIADQNDPKRP